MGAEQLRTIDANADLKAQTVDVGGSCTIYVGFNNARAPFDDAKVRLAFAKSFDRFVVFQSDNEVVETPEPVWDVR